MVATIQASNLTKAFSLGEQRVYALNDVSLEVHPGEMLAIVGSTRLGKVHSPAHPGLSPDARFGAGSGERGWRFIVAKMLKKGELRTSSEWAISTRSTRVDVMSARSWWMASERRP